jgi:hypothetical protein
MGYDIVAEGQVMGFICLLALYGISAAIFGELAGQTLGRPLMWTALFLVLPGVSHLFFLAIYLYMRHKARGVKVMQSLIITRTIRPPEAITPDGKVQVTPFYGPATVKESDLFVRPQILKDRQDREIEQMIQWREWFAARSIAIEKLEDARESKDARAIELFEAYLDLADQMMQPDGNGDETKDEPSRVENGSVDWRNEDGYQA